MPFRGLLLINSGLSPFLGNSNIETYDNITSCNYTLEEEQFDNVRL